MCPAPVRPRRAAAAARPAARAPQPAPAAAGSKRAADGFEPVRGGPYAALAAMGRYDSYVRTRSGVDVYVRIRPGRDAAHAAPLVFLDGLNGAAARSKGLDPLVEREGVTLVSLSLLGQGETLNRDLERTGGRSVQDDISPQAQAELVLETLDQLGVKGPFDLAGLSYGGGIAALVKRLAPHRVHRLLLAAPYTVTAMEHDPVRFALGELLNHNPFNPLGPFIYRSAVRAALAASVPAPAPIQTPKQRQAFADAVYRLTMGMEKFKLGAVLKGLTDVHLLTVPFDPVAPPAVAQAQLDEAATASSSSAPMRDTFAHDLIEQRPGTLVAWMARVLAGTLPATPRAR